MKLPCKQKNGNAIKFTRFRNDYAQPHKLFWYPGTKESNIVRIFHNLFLRNSCLAHSRRSINIY